MYKKAFIPFVSTRTSTVSLFRPRSVTFSSLNKTPIGLLATWEKLTILEKEEVMRNLSLSIKDDQIMNIRLKDKTHQELIDLRKELCFMFHPDKNPSINRKLSNNTFYIVDDFLKKRITVAETGEKNKVETSTVKTSKAAPQNDQNEANNQRVVKDIRSTFHIILDLIFNTPIEITVNKQQVNIQVDILDILKTLYQIFNLKNDTQTKPTETKNSNVQPQSSSEDSYTRNTNTTHTRYESNNYNYSHKKNNHSKSRTQPDVFEVNGDHYGNIHTKSDVIIHGDLLGNVHTSGDLIVHGDHLGIAHANTITIHGDLLGSVTANSVQVIPHGPRR